MLKNPAPMRLLRIPEPFDHPEFIFEAKIDGFRALAHVRGHHCQLVSRNGHVFKSWPYLAEEIAQSVRAKSCVIDGEICCLESDGRSNFKKLLFRREWPYFYAFDVLAIDGVDLRELSLLERKRRLVRILPTMESRLRYLDHIRERGRDLFSAGRKRDLEGIVAKWADGTYQIDGRATSWLKIKNTEYTQMKGRHELFAARHPEWSAHRPTSVPPALALR